MESIKVAWICLCDLGDVGRKCRTRPIQVNHVIKSFLLTQLLPRISNTFFTHFLACVTKLPCYDINNRPNLKCMKSVLGAFMLTFALFTLFDHLPHCFTIPNTFPYQLAYGYGRGRSPHFGIPLVFDIHGQSSAAECFSALQRPSITGSCSQQAVKLKRK